MKKNWNLIYKNVQTQVHPEMVLHLFPPLRVNFGILHTLQLCVWQNYVQSVQLVTGQLQVLEKGGMKTGSMHLTTGIITGSISAVGWLNLWDSWCRKTKTHSNDLCTFYSTLGQMSHYVQFRAKGVLNILVYHGTWDEPGNRCKLIKTI